MMAIGMDIERFRDGLDVHGPDLRRWPVDLAAEAQALLASSGAARGLLEAAQAVEAYLSAPPGPPASAELRARILAAATAQATVRRVQPARRFVRWGPVGAAAVAASLLGGLVIGLGNASRAGAAIPDAEIAELLFGPVAEDYEL
ncbi:MAG TPA: hypothetical protein VEY95_09980 [Azospirillaceae bacterium]|nr:hypothetical protein [Azospirillaceae bacterium]